jgi:hypothetical protein
MNKLGFAVVLAAALGAIPGAARAQSSVTCESYGGRRQTCRVDTRGEVRLTRQLSDQRCIRGRTWDTIPGAVWVDDGCRARFTAYGNNGSWGNNNDDRWGRDGRYDDRNGHGRNGRDGRWRNDDRDRVISHSWAMNLCRQAVRRQIGNRRVDLSVRDSNRDRVRVNWRAESRYQGTCRVERDGDVHVDVDRRR